MTTNEPLHFQTLKPTFHILTQFSLNLILPLICWHTVYLVAKDKQWTKLPILLIFQACLIPLPMKTWLKKHQAKVQVRKKIAGYKLLFCSVLFCRHFIAGSSSMPSLPPSEYTVLCNSYACLYSFNAGQSKCMKMFPSLAVNVSPQNLP